MLFKRKCKFTNKNSDLLSAIHRNKKLFIRFGLHKSVAEEFHSFNSIHVGQIIPENPYLLKYVFIKQQIFTARA